MKEITTHIVEDTVYTGVQETPGFKRQTLNLTYLAGPCEQGITTSNLNSSLSC